MGRESLGDIPKGLTKSQNDFLRKVKQNLDYFDTQIQSLSSSSGITTVQSNVGINDDSGFLLWIMAMGD